MIYRRNDFWKNHPNPQRTPDISVQGKVFFVWLLGDATNIVISMINNYKPSNCINFEVSAENDATCTLGFNQFTHVFKKARKTFRNYLIKLTTLYSFSLSMVFFLSSNTKLDFSISSFFCFSFFWKKAIYIEQDSNEK